MNDRKPVQARRMLMGGAATAGAAAAVAALLPKAQAPAATVDAGKPASTAAGYQLSDHVKRYYATTRI